MTENSNNLNIMIIDDTSGNREILSIILMQEKYTVQAAESGKIALEMMNVQVPDLVLLDICMPEMDGFEVCRKIKDNPKLCDIPILFISALTTLDDKLKAFDAGGVDYIEKPFNRQEVLARVSTHLKICTLQHQLQEQNSQLKDNLNHLRNAYNSIKKQDETWRKDLLKAQNIQLHILPESFPSLSGLDICGFYSPSTIVGGDFFDTIKIDESRTAVFLADVSGHGIAAAMVTVIIHEYIQSIKHLKDGLNIFSSPEEALAYFNRTMCEEVSLSAMHVTMVYAVIDSQKREMKIASAGHPRPVLISSGEKQFPDIEINPALGFSSSTVFHSSRIDFPEESTLLLYTDGLTESQNKSGVEFNLNELMEKESKEYESSALAFSGYIEELFISHLNGNLPFDDVSFLVVHASKIDETIDQRGRVKIYRHDNAYQESSKLESHISFAFNDKNIVIRTIGKLNWYYADPLKKFIDSTENVKKKSIFIDLSQCTYMDSTMLGTLFKLSPTVQMYNAHDRLLDQLQELGIYNAMDFADALPSISDFKLLKTQKLDLSTMGNLILEAHQSLANANVENENRFSDVIKTLQNEI